MVSDYRKRGKVFFIISAVSEVLSLSNEPQQLLDMVLDKLMVVLKIDCCWVQLLSLENNKLRLAAYRGFTLDMKRDISSMNTGHSFSNQVIGLGYEIIIPDLSHDKKYGLSSFTKAGLRSLVALPLGTYRTQGVIGIASRTKKRFRKGTVELLTIIAKLVGTALDKADLYQRTLAREKKLSTGTRLSVPLSLGKDIIRQEAAPKVTGKIRIFVIDGQNVFRQGLRLLLSQSDDIELAGESDFMQDIAPIIEKLSPNVVLIDINPPLLNGLDLARWMNQCLPSTSIIMLSSYEDDKQIFEALKAGAAGYLSKGITPNGFVSAIQRVFEGERIIEEFLVRPRVAQQVLKELQGKEKKGLIESVNPQELEMLSYFANGYSRSEVAHALSISEQRIAERIGSIVSKFVINGRSQ